MLPQLEIVHSQLCNCTMDYEFLISMIGCALNKIYCNPRITCCFKNRDHSCFFKLWNDSMIIKNSSIQLKMFWRYHQEVCFLIEQWKNNIAKIRVFRFCILFDENALSYSLLYYSELLDSYSLVCNFFLHRIVILRTFLPFYDLFESDFLRGNQIKTVVFCKES